MLKERHAKGVVDAKDEGPSPITHSIPYKDKSKSPPSSHWLLFSTCLIVFLGGLALISRQYLQHGPSGSSKVFLPEELRAFDGTRDGQAIYIALLGQVFDVSKGAQHYGPGGSYAFFAGVDATRAFMTGKFKEDLNDDTGDFTPEQFKSLVDWRDFYHKTYVFKGVVSGRFYSAEGQPTEVLRKLEKVGRKAQAAEQAKRAQQEAACGFKWGQAVGGEVWCESGQGYPRLNMEPSASGSLLSRCICTKSPVPTQERQIYGDCNPDAIRCVIPPA